MKLVYLYTSSKSGLVWISPLGLGGTPLPKVPVKCPLERKIGQRGKRPVKPLGPVNFTKVIFRPISKHLKLTESYFPERSKNFYSVLSRENSTVVITIFLVLFALIDQNVGASQEKDVRLITTSKKYLL